MVWFWLGLAIIVGQAACAILAIRRYAALPYVPTVPRRRGLPRVSIIVPARNEAANLSRLLPSLVSLDYPSYEVIVVDDGSTDATAAVAAEFDALVVHSEGPPPGWTGKSYACHLGALAATGEWLLFTDADTEHAPLSLASTLGFALDRRLEAVTLLTGQDCYTFWERVVIPFAYQQFFVAVPGAAVNRADRRAALANGQYILAQRDAYERSGGHDAVRDSLIEDVRLGQAMKAHGVRLAAARAEHLVRVRMYRSLTEMWHGFAKNAFLLLTLDARLGALAALSVFLAGLTPLLFAVGLSPGGDGMMALAGYSYAFLALGLMGWDRLCRVPPWYALLQPLSAVVLWLIGLNSAVRTLSGRGVAWKGRVYRPGAATPAAAESRDRTRQPLRRGA